MKLTFLGTGTSMGVPVAGGFGREKNTGDYRDERYRTSAWVETDKTSIVIDTGPEFRLQTLRAGIRKIDLLLLTHEHTDHIAGLDDLRPYNYVQKKSIPTYTTEECIASIKKRFSYMFGPDKTPGSVDIDFKTASKPFIFNDCKITPLPVDHGVMNVLGFRINDLVYITDAKRIPDETKELVKGAKVMVLNGLQWAPKHKTHFTIPEAVDVANELQIPITYLVHISSYVIHKEISAKLPAHVKLAYDQLTIQI
ncbi:MAG: MBL fold metallo-hydrolase [Balneolales bacterium]|nr:MBL fold metallo-hydrolase [Balneolales bacterium]